MREPFNEIQAAQIESVCTRFHNQLEHLCYRIVIRYTGQIMYRDFHNYQEYQQNHNLLIRAMHNQSTLPNIFRTVEMSR